MLATEIKNPTLRTSEIFLSLQGESKFIGLPTVFIRLTGCPLRCQYCDTSYAFSGGRHQSLTDIVEQVREYSARYVTVTGGEPLAQKESYQLLTMLCEQNYTVSLETSGAMNIAKVDPRVIKVMDIKTPSSGEVEKNYWQNLDYLTEQDQIKFVICNREDYEWSKKILIEQQLDQKCEILFSPSYQQLAPETLADWILIDRLPVRFQVQLHKILWGNTPGR